jgi:hypothetical protein
VSRALVLHRACEEPTRPKRPARPRAALRRFALFGSRLRRDEAAAHPLRKRLAVLVLALAVPAMAAPGDFGRIPGDAGADRNLESITQARAEKSPMPFERPGMSFPGSAFYFLADPPARSALIALPGADPLSGDEVSAAGGALDPGPAAAPFLAGGMATRAEQCLAEAIYHEAASESEAGQRAVAQVVLNRVRHPAWPNSVCAVVFQGSERATGCQFTFTCDGSRARTPGGAPWARAQRIARAALTGEVYAPIGLATHYHTHWVAPRWAGSLDHVGTIGAHRFYRARGKAGMLAAFDAAYAGFEPPAPVRASGRREMMQAAAPEAALASAPDAAVAPSAMREAAALTAPPAARSPAEPAAGSGSVRSEYRTAGRWKTVPGARAPAGERPAPIAPAPPAEIPRKPPAD